ncbi:tetratricopeptide repeat protein [Thermopirellula anaerolimosa]
MNTWRCFLGDPECAGTPGCRARRTPRRRLIALSGLACLLAPLLVGCRSMLELPASARDSGYQTSTQDDEGGWLFRRLTGQQSAADEPKSRTGTTAVADDRSTARTPDRQASPAASGAEAIPADEDALVLSTSDVPVEEETWGLLDLPERFVGLFKPKRDEALARRLFGEGVEAYRQKDYVTAAARFKKAAAHWPDSPLQEDALFYLGESYYFLDRYAKANEAYDQLLKKYEFTRYLDTAVRRQFAIGRYWEQVEAARPSFLGLVQFSDPTRPKFDTWGRALKAYQSVRLYDPTGPLADDSLLATGNAYFLKGRYEEAAFHYDLIRKDHPRSEYVIPASLLGIKSYTLSYQGPTYDGTPLEKAEEISDEVLALYSTELGDDRIKLIEEKNRIYEEKAMRDYAIGQYYDARKYYGAARYYYRLVLQDFPDSKAAVMAAQRIRQIDGLPDKPPDRFPWLTRWFESKDD